MKERIIFLLLFFAFTNIHASEKNVILRVSASIPADTFGYDILKELPKTIYNAIEAGKVKLWDTPQKKIELASSTLKEIEKSSGILFSSIDNFFIYEIWTEKKNEVSFTIEGFNFTTRNKKGEDVSLCYIDYKDLISIFDSASLPINANGYLNMTLNQVLTSKRYPYTILQYGKKVLNSIAISEQIRNETFIQKKIVPQPKTIVQEKRVVYKLDRGNLIEDSLDIFNLKIVNSVEFFLNQNQEEFFNIGGEKIKNHFSKKKITVSKIEVVEL